MSKTVRQRLASIDAENARLAEIPGHDMTIRYDEWLGVYRTYRGYRYQPGTPWCYRNPTGCINYLVSDSFDEFRDFVDRELREAA